MSCKRCLTSSFLTFQCDRCPQQFCAPCASVSGCLRSCAYCNVLLCADCESMDQCDRCGFFACASCRSKNTNHTNLLLCDHCPTPRCAECPAEERLLVCTGCEKTVCFDCYQTHGRLISCSGVWGFDYEGPTIVDKCEDPKLFCVDCSKLNLSSKGFPVFQEYDDIMAEVGYPYIKSLMCGTCHSKAVEAMVGQCARCEEYVPHCPEEELGFECSFCDKFYCGCCIICKKSYCDCQKFFGMKETLYTMRWNKERSLKKLLESDGLNQCMMCQKQEVESLYASNRKVKLFPRSVLDVVKSFGIISYFKNWDENTFESVMKAKSDENTFET